MRNEVSFPQDRNLAERYLEDKQIEEVAISNNQYLLRNQISLNDEDQLAHLKPLKIFS